MTTKKQERAELRIGRAKDKKERRFYRFIIKVAERRLKNPENAERLMTNFCCAPAILGMARDEFVSRGQMIGGAAVFFDQGELEKLLPNWRCSAKSHPAVLMVDYVERQFHEDGVNRHSGDDMYRTASSGSFSTSGSSSSTINW